MEITSWLAIVGALAWTPELVRLFRTVVSRAKIDAISPNEVSVGFTPYGPILNLNLAFTTKQKDIVITGVTIHLVHEKGDKRQLEWQGVQQNIMTMRSPDGLTTPYEKEASVLALKLTQKEVEERFVRFQEIAFRRRKTELESAVRKRIDTLRNTNRLRQEAIFSSDEMSELLSFVKNSFTWRVGTYSIELELEALDSFSIAHPTYTFELSQSDVELLKANIPTIEAYYKNEASQLIGGEAVQVIWNWANPVLRCSC